MTATVKVFQPSRIPDNWWPMAVMERIKIGAGTKAIHHIQSPPLGLRFDQAAAHHKPPCIPSVTAQIQGECSNPRARPSATECEIRLPVRRVMDIKKAHRTN